MKLFDMPLDEEEERNFWKALPMLILIILIALAMIFQVLPQLYPDLF